MTDPVTIVKQRWKCEAPVRSGGKVPGKCDHLYPSDLQVHELARGQWRQFARQYPEAMILICPNHHEFVTLNPEKAYELGLAWGPDSEQHLRALGWTSKTDIQRTETP